MLSCATQEYESSTIQWQWLLGRFSMLLKLIEDYPTEFVIQPHVPTEDESTLNELEGSSDSGDDKKGAHGGNIQMFKNHNKVSKVLTFTKLALSNAHQKVARIARRVFYMVARLQAHNSQVLNYVMNFLEGLDLNLQIHLKRRLLRMADEFNIAQQEARCVQNGEESRDGDGAEDGESIQPFRTPVISARSTPRSGSPTLSPQIAVPVNNFISGNITFLPTAPPNSPTRHRTLRHRTSTGHDDVESVLSNGPPSAPLSSSHSEPNCSSTDPSTPASDDTHQTEINTSLSVVSTSISLPNKVDVCIGTSPTLAIRGIPSGCSDVDLLILDQSTDETDADVFQEDSQDMSQADTTGEGEEDKEVENEGDDVDGEEEGYHSPSTPDDLSVSSANATAASSSGLTEDLSDLTLSPSTADINVSFKTEVASCSPQHYPAKKKIGKTAH